MARIDSVCIFSAEFYYRGLRLMFKILMCLSCCTGLFWTYVALNLMVGSGQPALLYIVPCTLGIFHLHSAMLALANKFSRELSCQ